MPSAVLLDKTWKFIESIDEAVDEFAVEAALDKVARPFGFTSIFGGLVPAKDVTLKEIPDRIMVQRFPEGWALRYNRQGYVLRDPIVERLQGHHHPFTWDEAYDASGNAENVELIRQEASAFGLRGGFVVPFALLDGAVAAVSFGGDNVELSPGDQSLLGFAASYAVGHLLQRRGSFHRARQRISAREYDCLLWAAEGKTDWEISVILGVSKPTIAKHIQSAREKLQAITKTHAIAIALRERIIR